MAPATGAWDYELLTRTPDFVPWLKYAVLGAGVVGAALALFGRRAGRMAPALVLALVVSLGLGSPAYAAATAAQTHSGSIPTSGPSSSAELLSKTTTTWAAAVSGFPDRGQP